MMEVVLVAEAKLRILQPVEALVFVLVLMLALALALELDDDEDELEVVDGVEVGELGVEVEVWGSEVEVVFGGGVYAGVVEVVVGAGAALGAGPEPKVHEPWSTPAATLPPFNALKRPTVRSRPLEPQPMHCGGEMRPGTI
jgi:hypothetical protein